MKPRLPPIILIVVVETLGSISRLGVIIGSGDGSLSRYQFRATTLACPRPLPSALNIGSGSRSPTGMAYVLAIYKIVKEIRIKKPI